MSDCEIRMNNNIKISQIFFKDKDGNIIPAIQINDKNKD